MHDEFGGQSSFDDLADTLDSEEVVDEHDPFFISAEDDDDLPEIPDIED